MDLKGRDRYHTRLAILVSREDMKVQQSAYALELALMYARASAHSYKQTDTTAHNTDMTKAAQSTNLHKIVCLAIFGSCSEYSLSECCRILAMVRAQMYIPSHEPCQIRYKR